MPQTLQQQPHGVSPEIATESIASTGWSTWDMIEQAIELPPAGNGTETNLTCSLHQGYKS